MPDMNNQEYLDQLRHSAAHLLAAAVKELWPEAKLTLGPAIEEGFYYDIDFPEKISENDLPKIEKRMRKLLPTWKEFSHREVPADEARELYADNPYKLELIEEIIGRRVKSQSDHAVQAEPITLYTSGAFTDLCRGGHVENPNEALKHFKLLSVAGAYWRGDEKNQMLTRIYGTAFPTAEELEAHLTMLDEAKKRDHRKLGQELDLFTFSPLVGSGLPLFTPRGTIVRRELEEFVQSIQEPLGYQRVWIPHITKPELYKTSGHWEKFEDDLFHVRGKNDSQFVMKPMNCPHHTQIYASKQRSYKELPLRYSEVTTVYRDEQAGELQGLSRVRSITQDDAHVFCRPDQIAEEISALIQACDRFHAAFGFTISIRLSLRNPKHPEQYLGDDTIWNQAEDNLQEALRGNGKEFYEAEGEAAFYGPKIDFMAKDAIGREWQISTIQLDFNQPVRFELKYTDANGEHQTPVMIHRAILGSVERFMSVIIEHYAGALPLWLSPVQAVVLPISDDQLSYAESVREALKAAGVRVEIDSRAESVGKKIREAELMKVPVMLVVGQKEVEAKAVAVRERGIKEQRVVSLSEVAQELQERITTRA